MLFSKTDLPSGTHTLKVVKASGQYMLLDALKVTREKESDGQNSGISPTAADFDKAVDQQADVKITLNLNGNTLTGVEYNGDDLGEDDYDVLDNTLTIKKQYLTQLPVGTTKFNVVFSAGDPQTLTIKVIDTSGIRFAMINNDDPAIKYSGNWSRSTGRAFGDYKDDVHYAEQNGDYFEYEFRGTGIQFLRKWIRPRATWIFTWMVSLRKR